MCVSRDRVAASLTDTEACMTYEPSFNELIKRLSVFPQVEAVLLSGSSASGTSDALSDYDLYVYLSAPLAAAATAVR